jgi:hypothetical protein
VLPSPPPISVFIPSPPTLTHNHLSFSLYIIYIFTNLATLQFFKPLEIRYKLHLPAYLTCFFLVFWWLESIHQLFMIFSSTFYRFFCNFGKGFCFNFSDLDLRSSNNNYKTRTLPTGSPASLDSTDGHRSLRRHLLPRAWHTCSRELSALSGAWMPCLLSPLSTSTASMFLGFADESSC